MNSEYKSDVESAQRIADLLGRDQMPKLRQTEDFQTLFEVFLFEENKQSFEAAVNYIEDHPEDSYARLYDNLIDTISDNDNDYIFEILSLILPQYLTAQDVPKVVEAINRSQQDPRPAVLKIIHAVSKVGSTLPSSLTTPFRDYLYEFNWTDSRDARLLSLKAEKNFNRYLVDQEFILADLEVEELDSDDLIQVEKYKILYESRDCSPQLRQDVQGSTGTHHTRGRSTWET